MTFTVTSKVGESTTTLAKTTDLKRNGGIYQAMMCSIAFFFLFTAVNAAVNVETLLLEDDGFGKLGFYSNAAVYLGVCLGSLYAESAIAKLGGLVNSLIFGAFLCVPYLASFLLPILYSEGRLDYLGIDSIYSLLLFTSFTHGIGEALLFVAQGTLISLCSTKYSNGFYFGMFHMFYMSSQLSGNYLSSWLLGEGQSQSVFIITLTLISILGSIIFCGIREPQVTGDNEYESTDDEGGDIEN
jgi:hypothetical protein